jgi:hypothetical protein
MCRDARPPSAPGHGRCPSARRSRAWRLVPRAACALATAVTLASLACAPSPEAEDQEIIAAIEQFRSQKDAAFAGDGSPVPPERRPAMVPLGYYPVSLDYRVPAVLRTLPDRPTMEMPTSTGQLRTMVRVGRLEFTLRGQPLSLSAFIEQGARDFNRLFVPFSDLTSGSETYPAGRYLDLERTPTGLYVIDFNRAYHPFCYYNEAYDCPYPPRENRLRIPLRAGERMKMASAARTRN